MKLIKRLFFLLVALVLLLGAGILFCAMNPSVTEKLADALYGEDRNMGGGLVGSVQGILGSPETGGADADGAGETGDSNEGGVPGGTDGSGGLPETGNVGTGAPGEVTVNILPLTWDSYHVPGEEVEEDKGVVGRSGYLPVQENAQELTESEAEKLKDLTVGATGTDLSFPAEYYPYYGMLESNMQQIYRQIYANALERTKAFAPVTTVTAPQLKNVFEAVFNDHPELFFLNTSYTCKYLADGRCLEIDLSYNEAAEDLENTNALFVQSANKILQVAKSYGTSLDQAKCVHDMLRSRVDYDSNAKMNQSAYSALVNGRSVCAGYARAYQYLLQQLQIPCYYCAGFSGEDHAWNIVKLGDTYTNVDVTWDDTDPATDKYFDKSDVVFAPTHVRKSLSMYLPACLGTGIGKPEQTQTPATEAPDESYEDALLRAGLRDSDVIKKLQDYYDDTLIQTVSVGSGAKQFTNVVTESLWKSIEQNYQNGAYEDGYVTTALKRLGKENFAIQIQLERLGGGLYRVYHNISVW